MMPQPSQKPPRRPIRGNAYPATSEALMTATIWIAIGSVFNAVPDNL